LLDLEAFSEDHWTVQLLRYTNSVFMNNHHKIIIIIIKKTVVNNINFV